MAQLASITTYRLTDHARLEMARRQITEAQIAQVLAAPEQTEPIRPGRTVYQSRCVLGDPPKTSVVRIVVDSDRQPPDVVTVYRTSKVAKYWRPQP